MYELFLILVYIMFCCTQDVVAGLHESVRGGHAELVRVQRQSRRAAHRKPQQAL